VAVFYTAVFFMLSNKVHMHI